MGPELVTITVGGVAWSAFTTITVNAAFDEAARDFTFTVAAEAGASATNAIFKKGAEVTINFNGDLVLTGNVNRKQATIEGDKAEINVSGRSASADLVDSSAVHKGGSFKKKDPKEIGDELAAKFTKTGFKTDQQLTKKDKYQITQGETVFRCIEKLCRQQGMTLTGTADGKINITKAGSKRHSGGLIQGENILKGGSDHNDSNQHSEIKVLGQRPFGHGAEALEIEAVAKASGSVGRYRPLIIPQDDDTTKDLTKKRAKQRRDKEAGDALKATISTQGFRDEGGTLWEPGYLVWVESNFLDIAQDMLIEKVAFQQDDSGSISTLSLTDPRSYGGEGGKGNKSGGEWSVDGGEAE